MLAINTNYFLYVGDGYRYIILCSELSINEALLLLPGHDAHISTTCAGASRITVYDFI